MESYGSDGLKKALTIEVRNKVHRIVQVRGPANRAPRVQEKKVLARWANATGLTIASWV